MSVCLALPCYGDVDQLVAQDQREDNLESFRDGVYTVLVATDVASRGLDIPDVKVRKIKTWTSRQGWLVGLPRRRRSVQQLWELT